jgi:hypothetical protein
MENQLQPLAGVEAINKNSALHKALAEMQHWQRCSKLLQKELNEIEDRNFAMKLWRAGAVVMTVLAVLGWLR